MRGQGRTMDFEPRALRASDHCADIAVIRPPHGEELPIVFNSPHSGRCYPRDFVARAALPLQTLRLSEDFLVDELFAAAPEAGCWQIAATRPRCWLDLNRAADELDATMFAGRPPVSVDATSERVRAGLGVLPRIVADGHEIYAGKLAWREAQARLAEGYDPYHALLRHRLESLRARFGAAVLIDCHSMPATAAEAMTPLGARRPDIILGDDEGGSCDGLLMDALAALFTQAGFNVSRNRVYTGGYITRHYGLGGLGFHAIQIEINRALYMDQRAMEPHAGFAALKGVITRIVRALPAYLSALWAHGRAAAE